MSTRSSYQRIVHRPQPPKESILVVDDNPISRLALVELFREFHYRVSECDTGKGCREALEKEIPDLILLDVRLPDANGMDLCREIKSDTRFGKVFIGLISASEITPDDQVEGLNLGADAYLVRPIQNYELIARVEALLRIQRAENALRRANEELEVKITDRTGELKQTNEALKAEVNVRRIAEEAQKRLAFRLQCLHSLDRSILQASLAEQIAEASLESLQELIPVDLSEVWRLNSETEQLTRLARRSRDQLRPGPKREIDHELRTVLERLTEVENLVMARSANPFATEQTPEGDWRRLCLLPLKTQETLLGVVVIASDQENPFTVESIRIAKEIANSLSIALSQAQLFDEVQASRERMQLMSQRVLEVQEEERRFLSRELHDEIGQNLTGIKAMLETGIKKIDDGGLPSLNDALGVVNELMQQVRQLSIDLRPQMLDELGLMKALDWQFNRLNEQAGLTVDFSHNAPAKRLPPRIEIALFRIVQEALTNVIRHATEKHAQVRLWVEDERCRLQIQDDGPGFEPRKQLQEFKTSGLTGMIERAELLGGELLVESTSEEGTCLTVDLPID